MNTSTFIDRIESEQDIVPLGAAHENGVHARKYQGVHGNLVIIDTTEEEIDEEEGKEYLMQLGLVHMIFALFPPVVKMNREAFKKSEIKGGE